MADNLSRALRNQRAGGWIEANTRTLTEAGRKAIAGFADPANRRFPSLRAGWGRKPARHPTA